MIKGGREADGGRGIGNKDDCKEQKTGQDGEEERENHIWGGQKCVNNGCRAEKCGKWCFVDLWTGLVCWSCHSGEAWLDRAVHVR